MFKGVSVLQISIQELHTLYGSQNLSLYTPMVTEEALKSIHHHNEVRPYDHEYLLKCIFANSWFIACLFRALSLCPYYIVVHQK